MIQQTEENNSKIRQILGGVMLLVCSALAVLIATSPGSVSVYRPGDAAAKAYSFFEQIPDVPVGICLLLAAAGSCVCLLLSVADMIFHKPGIRTGLMVTSLASLTLAVMPVVARNDVFVVPNMIHPLLMGVVCLGTYMLRKLYK